MNQYALAVYHALPPALQALCIRWHGRKLQKLRYGGVFRRELARYAERESWTRAQWADYQNDRLRQLLERAVKSVPYYRELHRQGRFPIEDVRSPADLPRLPILEKEAVRLAPLSFLADDCRREDMYEEHTSGTTATPLLLYWSHETVQSWYACFERRVRNWAGLALGEPWAIIGGQQVVTPRRKSPPFWVWNGAAKQLYMSCYFIGPRHVGAYVDELVRRKISYLYGYANSMDMLAQHILESGREDVRLKAVISNAEQLLPNQRRRMSEAFHCQVRDTYAPAELGVAAFECGHGTMHLSPDIGITEILRPDGTPADADESGEIVVTGLLNQDQILIRYCQGDRGALAPPEDRCPCGLEMPILRRIEGRTDDVLFSTDGRWVAQIDAVFKSDLRLKESQVIQTAPTRLIVKIVPAEGYGEHDEDIIRRGLRQRLGDMDVDFEIVSQVPRTANGKFRAAVNLLAK